MGPVGDGGGSVVISTLALKSLWKPRSFILCRWDLGRVYWILVLVPSYYEFPRNASVSEILNIYFCSSENWSQDLVSWPQLWAFLLACDLLYFFSLAPCMRACVHAQSRPTLCNSIDCSPQSSSIHGILQARILGWVAMLINVILQIQSHTSGCLYLSCFLLFLRFTYVVATCQQFIHLYSWVAFHFTNVQFVYPFPNGQSFGFFQFGGYNT